jgi:hypothetical protein
MLLVGHVKATPREPTSTLRQVTTCFLVYVMLLVSTQSQASWAMHEKRLGRVVAKVRYPAGSGRGEVQNSYSAFQPGGWTRQNRHGSGVPSARDAAQSTITAYWLPIVADTSTVKHALPGNAFIGEIQPGQRKAAENKQAESDPARLLLSGDASNDTHAQSAMRRIRRLHKDGVSPRAMW